MSALRSGIRGRVCEEPRGVEYVTTGRYGNVAVAGYAPLVLLTVRISRICRCGFGEYLRV